MKIPCFILIFEHPSFNITLYHLRHRFGEPTISIDLLITTAIFKPDKIAERSSIDKEVRRLRHLFTWKSKS